MVRLRQGDPDAQTIFADDPAAVARALGRAGRRVAARGQPGRRRSGQAGSRPVERSTARRPRLNLRRLAEIRAATSLPIQFGGGLRDAGRRGAGAGAGRDARGAGHGGRPPAGDRGARRSPRFGAERIVVGIDARDGMVATHGWQETSALDALTVARRMADLGVLRVVYTDIARDGMLTGVNVAATVALARASGLTVIASGGVASLDDIRALAGHASRRHRGRDRRAGAVYGRARAQRRSAVAPERRTFQSRSAR